MRGNVAKLLKGIDRYNPDNLSTLERYVEMQVRENTYDLEANLAVLKLYQFNPTYYNKAVVMHILLKALTNLPHTDFILCKCLIDSPKQETEEMLKIFQLADILETCQFKEFWAEITKDPNMIYGITGFDDSIRKYICHVVGISYDTIHKDVFAELLGDLSDKQVNQWVAKYGWKMIDSQNIFITSQEENIKTKNITEKITLESVAAIMTMAAHSKVPQPPAIQQ